MQRLLFCSFGLLGAFALSCQVLPADQAPVAFDPSGGTQTALPPVSAAPPTGVSLSQQVAWLEGDGGAEIDEDREWQVRRAIQNLEQRHTGLSQREIEDVAETIVDEAAEQGLDPALVLAVIHVESAGYNRAESSVGALGLMQIMPATGKMLAEQHGITWHGPATLFDPIVNVKLGVAYLSALSNRYAHVPTALAAYNWGPGAIDQRIRRGAEVPGLYIEQVMRAWSQVESVRELAADASS